MARWSRFEISSVPSTPAWPPPSRATGPRACDGTSRVRADWHRGARDGSSCSWTWLTRRPQPLFDDRGWGHFPGAYGALVRFSSSASIAASILLLTAASRARTSASGSRSTSLTARSSAMTGVRSGRGSVGAGCAQVGGAWARRQPLGRWSKCRARMRKSEKDPAMPRQRTRSRAPGFQEIGQRFAPDVRRLPLHLSA